MKFFLVLILACLLSTIASAFVAAWLKLTLEQFEILNAVMAFTTGWLIAKNYGRFRNRA